MLNYLSEIRFTNIKPYFSSKSLFYKQYHDIQWELELVKDSHLISQRATGTKTLIGLNNIH